MRTAANIERKIPRPIFLKAETIINQKILRTSQEDESIYISDKIKEKKCELYIHLGEKRRKNLGTFLKGKLFHHY